MYKERFVMRTIKKPEDLGKPGKNYCVTHYKPIEGGTCLACAGTRFFATQEEAEAYLYTREARLLAKERAKI